ncbi:TY2B-DR3 [Symbiodinium sp. CCMP2456]|nr:TY2B-DR3 [Symbiodinium sp. CCMP2456]
MSPTRTATLDGEVSGPNYDTTQAPPGLARDDAVQEPDPVVMNGTGPEPTPTTAAEDRTLPQPSGSMTATGALDFLGASTVADKDVASGARPSSDVPQGSAQSVPVISAMPSRVETGGFEFSPPEELPDSMSTETSNQTFWFAKIGEFVQRRVAQAGAAMTPILESGQRRSTRQVLTTPPRSQRLFSTEAEQAMTQWTRRAPHLYTPEQRAPPQEGSSNGSLTQEQVLVEVQKQVKYEMRTHEEERQHLAQENQQLKDMLEKDPREAVIKVAAAAFLADYLKCSSRVSARPADAGCGGANVTGAPQQRPAAATVPSGALGLPVGNPLQDPMGALVQGMAQLQTAMSQTLSLKSKDVEVVKPGLAELPRLPELSTNSAIDVGDWLHGLQNHMGDLSNSSSQWWSEVLTCLSKYYEAYLAASHVGKLSLKAEDYETTLLRDDRWLRVDKRASSMILASLPESVKTELLSSRVVGTLAMLCRVVVLYRPGSVAERQQILRALEVPTTATTASEAVQELRRWARWVARATDIGIQCPDPSVMIKGLDSIVKKILGEHADINFRISMLRYTLEVDTRPTLHGAKSLQQALLSELEQVAYRGRQSGTTAPAVKAIAAGAPPSTGGRSDGQVGGAANGSESGSPTRQPKAKAKASCKFYLSDKGCSRGSACTFSHVFTRKEKMGRCWACGSTQHHQNECPTKVNGGSPTSKAGDQSKASPAVKAISGPAQTSATSASATSTATTSAPSVTGEQSSAMPEAEIKSLLEEASAMLKEIRREAVLSQGRHGTLLAKKTGAASSAPIVPLGALVEELGCQISWSRRGGLVIRHPQHGVIPPAVVGRCPVVGETQALDLIREIETRKLRTLENATRTTAKALWLWDEEKPWARHLDDFVKVGGRSAQLAAMTTKGSPFVSWTDLERSLLAENIDLSDRAGWGYLRAVPGSRQRRKRMMTLPWVVHLYSGPGKALDPVFRELDDGRVMVQVDINRSKAEDMNMVAGMYRALLWAAATGRIDGILGSPPQRPELVQRMMWLTVVAKAARAAHGGALPEQSTYHPSG